MQITPNVQSASLSAPQLIPDAADALVLTSEIHARDLADTTPHRGALVAWQTLTGMQVGLTQVRFGTVTKIPSQPKVNVHVPSIRFSLPPRGLVDAAVSGYEDLVPSVVLDWGDGTEDIFTPPYLSGITHTYAESGTYVVKASVDFAPDIYGQRVHETARPFTGRTYTLTVPVPAP